MDFITIKNLSSSKENVKRIRRLVILGENISKDTFHLKKCYQMHTKNTNNSQKAK